MKIKRNRLDQNIRKSNRTLKSEIRKISQLNFPSLPKAEIVQTKLGFLDLFGAFKARLGIGRMKFIVTPGLYQVGGANENSPVLVTANYKMSFDSLRKELNGVAAWILVLDTNGVNVWCAAGKGTFGTEEIITRLIKSNLSGFLKAKVLVIPQLGATGVSFSEVQKRTGFKVVYGPIRAKDVKQFLNSNMKATREMREITFSTNERMILTPIEVVRALKPALIIFGTFFIVNIFKAGFFTIVDLIGYLSAMLIGCVLVPLLLPYIPGAAFSWKGWLLGFIFAILLNALNYQGFIPEFSLIRGISYVFIFPAISAYYGLNFTGSSTYTSLSGVLKETKAALPLMKASMGIGLILILVEFILFF